MISSINRKLDSNSLTKADVDMAAEEISETLANLRSAGEVSNDAFLEAGIIQGGLNVLSNMIEQGCSNDELSSHLQQLTARTDRICSAYPELEEIIS
ncbi:MAG TPA: hypothetical protein QGF70_01110 [Candidatus Thalassarchaeaceae archaeon]|jgi:hypothetical protein|nr:hypothetical protein [Candidatus Thalassarchaeaceae archaeon]HJL64159.1 hypothetical protein [Candidatus Thalassarchaeaceae archaeon]|tara:strand:- start:329 stop:619 length:291 start_codon:yes stop_codon:yes gene_type:complete